MNEIQKEIKPANIQSLLRQSTDVKLERDDRGRLIDPRTGRRVHYVIHVTKAGMKIRTPGETYKDARGTEYMVMPSGSIRRLTPKKGE